MAAVGADVTAAALIPRHPSLSRLREAAAGCRACELWRKGTQTVFGEGSPGASVMLVGEQPGDREDLIGHPFIGPAGALLDRALAEAGISRDDVYLTNVVQHFNWEARGKRRIHRKPNLGHIRACRPWLDAEIKLVDPEVLVLLGRPPPSRSLAATSGSPSIEASSRTLRSPPWSWPRSIPRRSSACETAPLATPSSRHSFEISVWPQAQCAGEEPPGDSPGRRSNRPRVSTPKPKRSIRSP
jgi:uracil-DNA glycosylase family 4